MKEKTNHPREGEANEPPLGISRRTFLKASGMAGGALLFGYKGGFSMANPKSRVTLVNTEDRKSGVVSSLKTLNINPVKNKDVLIKPNFNTADRVPGSTDNETLVALVEEVWNMGAKSISLGERSFPPTRQVMEQKGVIPLMEKMDVRLIDFDDLDKKDWVAFKPKDSHWSNGFRIARPILDAECLVSTCCLKTHQFGGVITLSLKLHVGVVPTTRHGYEYMTQLHSSPHQQKMIAEINAPFSPTLIVLDGIDAFVDGGPMEGQRVKGDVMIASTDRIAIDAVGTALLKVLGSNDAIMGKKIFEQEQIARAVELGLGVSSPTEIDLFAATPESRGYAKRVNECLGNG